MAFFDGYDAPSHDGLDDSKVEIDDLDTMDKKVLDAVVSIFRVNASTVTAKMVSAQLGARVSDVAGSFDRLHQAGLVTAHIHEGPEGRLVDRVARISEAALIADGVQPRNLP